MQRFSRTLAYGVAAAALSMMTVNPADAQRGGHGGGSRGGMSGGSRGGSTMQHNVSKGSPVSTFKNNGGMKQDHLKQQMDHRPFDKHVVKNDQFGKGFAKGEPNPNAPGGFKKPSDMGKWNSGSPFKGKSDFCGTPWGGKYCNNWNWKSNWNFHCGWNYGCYPYGCFYPRTCWYPWFGCSYYPTCYSTYCFNPCYYTPLCYTQTVFVPPVEVVAPVVAPVEEVTSTTTVAKTTTQKLIQPGVEALTGTDLSFITGSAINQ